MNGPTHTVTNQVPDLIGINLYDSDPVLRAAVARSQAEWHDAALSRLGERLGQADMLELGRQANRYPPELRTHNRIGERIDQVDFHPSWHRLLTLLRREGLHASPWADPRPGAWAARTAGYFLHGQVEAGSLCPTTMTFACIPVLQKEPALFAELGPKLYAHEHDPRDLPWQRKTSVLIGMGMTEKQGGSDLRTNTTRATPLQGEGRGAVYRLVGHKWFFSAPMCDAHLVLARTGAASEVGAVGAAGAGGEAGEAADAGANNGSGLSCFFVPRWRPDGSKNPIHLQRLKDKLGNRSNSSCEVEFQDAWGLLVGEPRRGVPTIIEMATYTRLDCVIGSAAIMRQALVQALHHARHRSAFGRLLAEQPLMRNVLADMALESEAATLLMMRLAQAFERNLADPTNPVERAWRRIVTPAAKFWVCKRAVELTGEAMEVWGGNGYIEEGPMARLYREAPVNSIWEGSGNVMCLDVLRAIEREPDAAMALLDELRRDADAHALLLEKLAQLQSALAAPRGLEEREARETLQAGARELAQQLVLCAQGTLMVQHAPTAVTEAFLRSRLRVGHGRVYGTLDPHAIGPDVQRAIVERAWSR